MSSSSFFSFFFCIFVPLSVFVYRLFGLCCDFKINRSLARGSLGRRYNGLGVRSNRNCAWLLFVLFSLLSFDFKSFVIIGDGGGGGGGGYCCCYVQRLDQSIQQQQWQQQEQEQ